MSKRNVVCSQLLKLYLYLFIPHIYVHFFMYFPIHKRYLFYDLVLPILNILMHRRYVNLIYNSSTQPMILLSKQIGYRPKKEKYVLYSIFFYVLPKGSLGFTRPQYFTFKERQTKEQQQRYMCTLSIIFLLCTVERIIVKL